ncbi:cysteine desulfurase [Jatrophihabitans cynanchi]|jgi:cysteine desulfurase/selenocysteine lyase|uniref:cysteine desulfurase n=1 Tax=Jatrophihabitans cynanchi TaxID=2944128 RepID=A0ABY7JXA5_9ACTN|nr:cysteine desulfurase [Jatrophihabitans sp. SB3-54]WAX57207.1 cysteine desulfurase [Jatrophihabitans sp. SB3-54]
MPFDVDVVRKDFPILAREVHGVPLVYLDSANTSQKPQVVLDTLSEFYANHNANVARAVHTLGSEATNAFERARDKVAAFINAPNRDEVVFTKNSSEALNLVAYCLSNATTTPGAERFRVGPGDEIVVTEMEHHSNIVPWQLLAQRTGATFRWLPIDTDGNSAGRLVDTAIDEVITERTKVVAFVHQSNALGTINPVARIVARARQVGALTVVDASQSAPHLPLDVQALGADFVAFTGHKLYGPTGVGVLWGRYELLAELPPFLGGGEMIETVDMTGTTFAAPPHRFEAGTPMIAQAVGLGAAIDYVSALGMTEIAAREHQLVEHALAGLATVDGLRIIGPATSLDRGATISFTIKGVHPHDVAQLLDEDGIAVRAGHHCARPVCVRYGIPATTRASFGVYTTTDEIDALVRGVDRVKAMFS